MAILDWKNRRNLENSLVLFLQNAVSTSGLQVIDIDNGEPLDVSVVAGYQYDSDWSLPIIQVYVDGKTSPRLSIGSNKRQNSYLVIIDIRAKDKPSQIDLTEWVEQTINDGFDFNEYSPNPGDPENMNATKTGYVSVDFVSNIPLRLGDNVDLFDKYRQNITISAIIE